MKKIIIAMTVLAFLCICTDGIYIKRKIALEDLNPPVFQMDDEILRLSITDGDYKLLENITATDPEDGDVSNNILIENIEIDKLRTENENVFDVMYAAFDSAGNSSETTRKIIYTDYHKPYFELSRPLEFTEGDSINLLDNLSAVDVLDGDVSPFITIEGAEKLNESTNAGEYRCTVSVTNSVGDKASLTIPVTITEQSFSTVIKPDLYLTDYLVYTEVGSYFEPLNYLDHINDEGYCQIDYGEMVPLVDEKGNEVKDKEGNLLYVTQQVAEGSVERWVNASLISCTDSVDTSKKGIYTVKYSYTPGTQDRYGRDRTCYATLIVVVE